MYTYLYDFGYFGGQVDSYILVNRLWTRRIPETMLCRILMFMWSCGPLWKVPDSLSVPPKLCETHVFLFRQRLRGDFSYPGASLAAIAQRDALVWRGSPACIGAIRFGVYTVLGPVICGNFHVPGRSAASASSQRALSPYYLCCEYHIFCLFSLCVLFFFLLSLLFVSFLFFFLFVFFLLARTLSFSLRLSLSVSLYLHQSPFLGLSLVSHRLNNFQVS